MRVSVDLNQCQNHGLCVFAAPAVFSLDDDGKLAFRHEATEVYRSEQFDESLRDELEEAMDVCPQQAITLED